MTAARLILTGQRDESVPVTRERVPPIEESAAIERNAQHAGGTEGRLTEEKGPALEGGRAGPGRGTSDAA